MSRMDISYGILAVVAVLAAVFSLTVGASSAPDVKKALLVLWLIGPPLFFFFEYWLRYDTLSKQGDLEKMKDLQQRGTQIWAGVAAALAAVYFKC